MNKKLLTLTLPGAKVPVILKKMKDLDGSWEWHTQTISIDPRLKGKAFKIILVHELLHALISLSAPNMISAVKNIKDNDEAEEAIVAPLSAALLAALSDNPKLRKLLFDDKNN